MFSSITCFALHRGELLVFLLILCSARFRTSCFISLCLCLLLPWGRSFLSKGTVFLLKPTATAVVLLQIVGHPCKQACRCLFYLYRNLLYLCFMGTLVLVVSLRFPVIQTLCSCFALPGLLLLLPGCP